MIDSYRQILVHLEVKVGGIHSVIVPDRADLLPSRHMLPFLDHDPVEMSVERVGEVDLPVLNPCMTDHHYVSPVGTDIAPQNNKAIGDGMHGMSKRLPLSSGNDPVLPKMTMCPEAPRLAKSGAVGRRDWKIESIGRDG